MDWERKYIKGMSNLTNLPKHMQTKEWIESAIRYEEDKGLKTYHLCKCQRNQCRSVMCAECWKECLRDVQNRIDEKIEMIILDVQEDLESKNEDIRLLQSHRRKMAQNISDEIKKNIIKFLEDIKYDNSHDIREQAINNRIDEKIGEFR